MSKTKHVIIPSPPLFLREGNKERQVLEHYTCSCCQGNGFFWKTGADIKEKIKAPCSVCGGRGRLKAEVTIEWLPEDEKTPSKGESCLRRG
jgi:hypothetical protein